MQLSEKEFNILKSLVNTGSFVIMLPGRKFVTTGPEDEARYYDMKATFDNLVAAGLIDDKTTEVREQINKDFLSGKYKEGIEQLKELGMEIPEDYQFESYIYALTENAVRMFAPPERTVN